jgi:hypothetical protein
VAQEGGDWVMERWPDLGVRSATPSSGVS